ncbi:MAG: rhomboid family intramembrane serine protease [Chloroflexi bacterium]|nr:rhomboid family intramembrane serine protease [Chloroflexota bacterium]
MIPLHDPDMQLHTKPYVIYVLVAINVLVYVYAFFLSEIEGFVFVWRFGLIPDELTGGTAFESIRVGTAQGVRLVDVTSVVPTWMTVFTSMFLHGGFMHVAGNMLFLWVFGDNVENRLGRTRFIAFYLGAGVAAALAQVYVDTDSQVPMIGASGAVAGVLGAYLVLYPRSRINTLLILGWFIMIRRIPALWLIGFWSALQIFGGLGSLASPGGGGVAYFAHLGGLAAGLAFGGFSRARAGWHLRPRQFRPRG